MPNELMDDARLRDVTAAMVAALPAQEEFDNLTKVAARAVNVPVSLVSLVDSDRQCFVGRAGIREPWATTRVTPLSHSFCQHVLDSEGPLVIEDSRNHPLVQGNLGITELDVIAYLGVPLRAQGGAVLGSLCAIDVEPRSWSEHDIELLAGFGTLAESILSAHLSALQLKQARDQMARLERMDSLGRLSAGVVHDLNNLLTNAGLSAQLALDAAPDEATQHLEAVIEVVRAGSRLTRRLLAFSRTSIVEFDPVEASRALYEMETILRTSAPKELNFHLQCDIPVDDSARVDRGRLEQLILNLVSNAFDATPDGGSVSVTAELHQAPAQSNRWGLQIEGGDYLRIKVRDTGSGIPDSVAKSLFEPFVTTKPPGIGTGLGLSSVYGILRRAKGSIDFSTQAGRGTTFDVLLPLIQERLDVGFEDRPTDAVDTDRAILIVDDEPSIRGAMSRILRRLGYATIEACGLEDALAKAPDGPFLLITDLRLGDGDGLDLAERLIVMNSGVEVVLMSGDFSGGDLTRVPVRARRGILTKPFLLDDVRRILTGEDRRWSVR